MTPATLIPPLSLFVCFCSWLVDSPGGMWRGGWAGNPSGWYRLALCLQEGQQEEAQLRSEEAAKHGKIETYLRSKQSILGNYTTGRKLRDGKSTRRTQRGKISRGL